MVSSSAAGEGGEKKEAEGESWVERERRLRLEREREAGLLSDIRDALPQVPRRVYHLHGGNDGEDDGASRIQIGRRRVRSGSEVFGEA